MIVLLRFLMMAAIALIVGLASAQQFVERGFFATTKKIGPWRTWLYAGTADADPYTVAHFTREGTLPVNSKSAITFSTRRDSSGSRLSGDCTYEISGRAFAALWWGIGAFTLDGSPVESGGKPSSFNSYTIVTAPDGQFVIRLSPEVQPGNWLASRRNTAIELRLTVFRPLNGGLLLQSSAADLPQISLAECL